jgi:hypothetical protein
MTAHLRNVDSSFEEHSEAFRGAFRVGLRMMKSAGLDIQSFHESLALTVTDSGYKINTKMEIRTLKSVLNTESMRS